MSAYILLMSIKTYIKVIIILKLVFHDNPP
jgi:hypothetical protein